MPLSRAHRDLARPKADAPPPRKPLNIANLLTLARRRELPLCRLFPASRRQTNFNPQKPRNWPSRRLPKFLYHASKISPFSDTASAKFPTRGNIDSGKPSRTTKKGPTGLASLRTIRRRLRVFVQPSTGLLLGLDPLARGTNKSIPAGPIRACGVLDFLPNANPMLFPEPGPGVTRGPATRFSLPEPQHAAYSGLEPRFAGSAPS